MVKGEGDAVQRRDGEGGGEAVQRRDGEGWR